MFAAETYRYRRDRLRHLLESGLVLFPGHDQSCVNYPETYYPFRQDSSFLYFFGLDRPGLIVLLDLDQGREVLFGPEASPDDLVWSGPGPGLAELGELSGVQESRPVEGLAGCLDTALAQKRYIHYLPQYRPESVLKLAGLLGLDPGAVNQRTSLLLIRAVVSLRSVKTDEEIAEIEAALETTRDMQLLAMAMVRPGLREKEVAGAILGLALAHGGPAFAPVVTTQGQFLHNPSYDNLMQEGQLLINDCGAESKLHYAADITRTIPVSGRFTGKQKDIYRIVLQGWEEATRAIRPGIRYLEVHLLAARGLARGLRDLGLMRGDGDEAVAAGAHALFFPHGLGHMVGLDVH
ncbi:MAG: aminopeptidase P family protein, partial [Thermodesulfobacteriota bacterium]